MVGLEAVVATKMNAWSQRKGQCGVEKQRQLGGHQNADWVGLRRLCGGRDKNQFLVVIDAEVSQEELGFSKADKKHSTSVSGLQKDSCPQRGEGRWRGVHCKKSFAGRRSTEN